MIEELRQLSLGLNVLAMKEREVFNAVIGCSRLTSSGTQNSEAQESENRRGYDSRHENDGSVYGT